MKVEIRGDTHAVISGYVNAVERLSKPIKRFGRVFRERIMPGAFERAIESAKNSGRSIRLLRDHDKGRVYSDTSEGTLELKEDSIGLFAKADVRNAKAIEEIKQKGVRGWSFGMKKAQSEYQDVDGVEVRSITDFELTEVSLLIDKNPAYAASSFEIRSDEGESEEEFRGFEGVEIESLIPEEAETGVEERAECDDMYTKSYMLRRLKL